MHIASIPTIFYRFFILTLALAVFSTPSAFAQDETGMIPPPAIEDGIAEDAAQDEPDEIFEDPLVEEGTVQSDAPPASMDFEEKTFETPRENMPDKRVVLKGERRDNEFPAARFLNPSLKMTLRQAVGIGLSTNPEYGVVAASRRATDEELNQGEALFLPSVDMRADTGYEYTNNPATRASGGDDHKDLPRYLASVTLTQLLFDGGEAHYEVLRQKARVRSAANRVRETSELVGLSIIEAYLEVLRQRELLQIARENVGTHVEISSQIQESVEGGRSTQADYDQSQARLAQARATESSTRQALRNAEARYIQEVGDMPGELEVPSIPYGSLEETVGQQVESVLAFSPTLDIFEADIEAAYAESQGTRSTFYPQVDLELNATQGTNLNGVEDKDQGATALVVMNWNLYRGGADSARAREFIHRHQQAKESRVEAARSVENDVRQTWASMVSAREREIEFARQAQANEKIVGAYLDQFNLNRRTLLDVLDSQNELFVSRSNSINSKYLEIFAVYRLIALNGQLLPTLGMEYPREARISSDVMWDTERKMDAR